MIQRPRIAYLPQIVLSPSVNRVQRLSHDKRTAVLSLLVAGLLSLQVWLAFTDSLLWPQFWPEDIHERIVRWLGGSLRKRPPAAATVELEWASVFIRVLIGGGAVWMAVRTIGGWVHKRAPLTSLPAESISKIERGSKGERSLHHVSLLLSGSWLGLWVISPLLPFAGFASFLVIASPMWLAVSIAVTLELLLGFSLRPDLMGETAGQSSRSFVSGERAGRWTVAVVVLAMLCWQATSFWLNKQLYDGLLVPHGDSAMYEEHLWNVWHGKGFRSYLDQGLFLGEHIQVIHLLLLPLHMLWPSYLMMELCASGCLALCCLPIYSMARRHSGSPRAAMWMALAWLVYFPMHYLDIAIDLKTLRPSCYGLPFLFWGIDLGERGRWKGSVACLLVALLTQEDFALITGSIGMVFVLLAWKKEATDSLMRDQRRWGAGVFVGSVLWVLAAVLVVIPAFRGGEVVHYSRYFGDLGNSPGDLVRTALTNPGKVMSIFLSQRTLVYVLVLSAPLAFLSLRRPVYLLGGLATFGMLSLIQLGNGPGEQTGGLPPVPYHHFHAPLLPVVFWAAAASLAVAGTINADRRARLAFFCAAFTGVTGSLMPTGATFWSTASPFGWRNLYVPRPRAEALERVLSTIPMTARVASTDFVHTRLTHFERSYDYSDYPRAVNDYKPGVPPDTDYIIIDTTHRYSTVRSLADVRELREEPDQWEVLPDETGGLLIMLKRRSGP